MPDALPDAPGRGRWAKTALWGLCRVMLVGVGLILALGMLVLHLLALVFFPVFAAVDWLRPSRRDQARRTMAFLLVNRPFWRTPARVLSAVVTPRTKDELLP